LCRAGARRITRPLTRLGSPKGRKRGFFWTKPVHKLVLNPYQIQCLRDAGLLPKPKLKPGEKEIRFPPHSGACPFFAPVWMNFPALKAKGKKRRPKAE
jgi:hypothetical protein